MNLSAARQRLPLSEQPAWHFVAGNALALTAGLLVCNATLLLMGSVNLKQWDFFVYYVSAHLVLDGHSAWIYNLRLLGGYEQILASPWHVPAGVLPALGPPFLSLLTAPLALLPYVPAYFLWMGLNSLALAWCLYPLELYTGLDRRGGLAFRAAAFVSLPVLVALVLGQLSVLILTSVTLAFVLLERSRDGLAGAALAFVLIKPQYAVPILLVLLLRGRWRALAGFVSMGAFLAIVPMPVMGLDVVWRFAHLLWQARNWGSEVPGFDPVWNRTFAGAMALLLPHAAATGASVILDLLALGALAISARRSRATDLPYALAVVVAIVISPHVLIHDLTLLLVPIAIALHHRGAAAHLGVVLWGCYLSILVGFALALAVPVQLPVIGMVALGIWLLRVTLVSARHSDQVPEPLYSVGAAPC